MGYTSSSSSSSPSLPSCPWGVWYGWVRQGCNKLTRSFEKESSAAVYKQNKLPVQYLLLEVSRSPRRNLQALHPVPTTAMRFYEVLVHDVGRQQAGGKEAGRLRRASVMIGTESSPSNPTITDHEIEAILREEEKRKNPEFGSQEEVDALIEEEVALLLEETVDHADSLESNSTDVSNAGEHTAATKAGGSLICADEKAACRSPDAASEPEVEVEPCETEKTAIKEAFMRAADKLAMGELLKALGGSKWRLRLFDNLQAGTSRLQTLKRKLDEAIETENEAFIQFIGSLDVNEFRVISNLGLVTPEDSRRAVVHKFCELWTSNLQVLWEEMHSVVLQRVVRCWRARKRIRQRRKEHFALVDGFGRFGLDSVMKRICAELGIQSFADAAQVTNQRIATLTWMDAQTKQRFRNFQNVYAKPVPGVFSHESSAQGFSRTTSLVAFTRTASVAAASLAENVAFQRAMSVETDPVGAQRSKGGRQLFGAGRQSFGAPSSPSAEQEKFEPAQKAPNAVFSRVSSGPIARVASLSSGAFKRVSSGPIASASESILRTLSAEDKTIDKMLKVEEFSKRSYSKIYNKHDFWENDFQKCLACNKSDIQATGCECV